MRGFLLPSECVVSNSKCGQSEEVLPVTEMALSESTCERAGPAERIKPSMNRVRVPAGWED